MSDSQRLAAVLTAIDECNRQDPTLEIWEGASYPKALLYGQRMSAALDDFAPAASEELKIAARAQHIERWRIPRSDYPMDRSGYLTWRRTLGKFHADRTCQLMETAGYDPTSQAVVQQLLTKQGLKQNPQTQTLEDVICLVFVQFYLTDFATTQDTEKLLSIIKKTWAKMSPQGQQKLLSLPLNLALKSTLELALAS